MKSIKTLPKHNICVLLIALFTIIFSLNIFPMNMKVPQAQQRSIQKYMLQLKEQQKKLESAIIPVRSFERMPTATPVIFYNPDNKKIELNFVVGNILEKTLISLTQISRYNMSPQKKYLILQTNESQQTKITEGFVEQGLSFALSKVLKRPIGEKVKVSNNITKIIDLQNKTEIGSFDGDLITCEFSPNETTLLIARRHLSQKLSNMGPLPLGPTPQRPQNDTTRYELFDIPSKTIIKTFENVQAINYTQEDSLITENDKREVEQITIQRNTWFGSPQITTTQGSIQDISKKITYYDATKELYVDLPNRKQISLTNVISYALSPLKNYLIIMKESATMNLINMRTGYKIENVAFDTITYEFSPSEKEDRLITLGSPREYFTGQNFLYYLLKLEKTQATSLTTFNSNNAFYFKSPDELIIVDKDSILTSCNPETGLTQQQQIQKKLELEQLEKAKQRKEELIKHQQELQKYYEESTYYKEPLTKSQTEGQTPTLDIYTSIAKEGIAAAQKQATVAIDHGKEYFEQAKEYLKSLWHPPVAQPLESPKRQSVLFNTNDDIENLMGYFNTDKEKINVTKIITKLSNNDNQADRQELIKQYNNYDNETKKAFASYFFTAPAGSLEISLNSTYATGSQFYISVVNNKIYVSNKETKKIVFFSKELDHEVKVMAFSPHDAYLAISYEDTQGIDLFIKKNDTFSLYKKIELSDFAPIIGLKFITTNNNTYLFFIDMAYKMQMYDFSQPGAIEYETRKTFNG